ncbi:MAG: tRNA (guanosine(37)-N1)-methyltransferase TrmD [Candidatus Omnitrophica bacterium]|nr:tRNA (guanosine(37)-N1)-methyltransferase TrmD [Candidatus Omnitrophota bacterium]MDD5774789.1 tRNA (guanosine(37)-N1)-methyltransferase TrmD [Candidatus Omnitrophota bacterium]
MRIDIISIFPGMFEPVLNESMVKRAREKGALKLYTHDLRSFSTDKHSKVDDRPFGGGPGMVMMADPIFRAVEAVKKLAGKASAGRKARVILLCPQGKTLTQAKAKQLSRCGRLILICGHYEGVDERVRRHLVDEEISIGDYILTGGELPAMVLVDAVARLLPGVLGDKNSLNFESFEGNLLEYAHYTRPADYRGMKVPAVLVSGDHTKIGQWRREQALARTRQRRPDLLKRR